MNIYHKFGQKEKYTRFTTTHVEIFHSIYSTNFPNAPKTQTPQYVNACQKLVEKQTTGGRRTIRTPRTW